MAFGHNLHYIIYKVYGSVWNSENCILHGCSVRIFCFFMPGGRFVSPRLDFGILGQQFGPGTFLG